MNSEQEETLSNNARLALTEAIPFLTVLNRKFSAIEIYTAFAVGLGCCPWKPREFEEIFPDIDLGDITKNF